MLSTGEVWFEKHVFALFADYHQLYLQDESAEFYPSSDFWGDEALACRLAQSPGVLSISTARNMTVPLAVQVQQNLPADDLYPWDHVADASLAIPTGRLVVSGCTDYFPGAARIAIPPAMYRVRVYFAGLGTLSWDGLEGDDHYQAVLWPAAESRPTVLKQWSPPSTDTLASSQLA